MKVNETNRSMLNSRKYEHNKKMKLNLHEKIAQSGRIGYVVLWFLGVPVSLLLLIWLLLGNNIFGTG